MRISSAGTSMRPSRSCCSRSRRILAARSPIAISPPATPIWVGLTKQERDCAAVARHDTGRHTGCQLLAEPGAPRTVSVRPAPGGGRSAMSQTRRLAAILAADVAGYSRLIGADEGGTLERLRTLRRELLDPKIAEHKGRLVKTTGDGLLVEFGSVVDALRCAVDVQREMIGRNTGASSDSRVELRIGINVGDIVVEDGDIFGDGVNVAARLEGLAEPGGVCISARVQEDAAGRLDLAFEDIGE